MSSTNKDLEEHDFLERHVRTNLTIASSGKFKGAVLQLAIEKNMTISSFVRNALCEVYPKLKSVDGYSEHAEKRNIFARGVGRDVACSHAGDEILLFE
ncbi:hypothetical protein [Burkholderia pseudomallei]|uniref:hypothetical protein n=1 Tax=Burkholderia pseudomallei TaxID=28450 RepID=UPI0011C4E4ED|nr:hypothetical protein [Burkholderia pseudomallei]